MTNKIFIRLIFCTLVASCDDIFHYNDEYFNLNNHLKRIADFKKGSYWIYHNDSLNINDTISVSSYERRQTNDRFDSHYQYFEEINIMLRSTYWNCEIKDMMNAYFSCNYERWYSENPINGKLGYNFDFKGDSLSSQYGKTKYLNNFSFNGKILNQVICFYAQGEIENDTYLDVSIILLRIMVLLI